MLHIHHVPTMIQEFPKFNWRALGLQLLLHKDAQAVFARPTKRPHGPSVVGVMVQEQSIYVPAVADAPEIWTKFSTPPYIVEDCTAAPFGGLAFRSLFWARVCVCFFVCLCVCAFVCWDWGWGWGLGIGGPRGVKHETIIASVHHD